MFWAGLGFRVAADHIHTQLSHAEYNLNLMNSTESTMEWSYMGNNAACPRVVKWQKPAGHQVSPDGLISFFLSFFLCPPHPFFNAN